MKRDLLALVMVSFLIPICGCMTTCGPFDYEYNAYGGRYDRIDRVNGRAGSRLTPAQAVIPVEQTLGSPPVEAADAAEASEKAEIPVDSKDRFE